jgi:hypothetical protein
MFVLTDAQRHRESARQRVALFRAQQLRAQARKAREEALRVTTPNRAAVLMSAARDFDFLAELEERPQRPCL